MAYGAIGTTDSRRGETLGWRLLSKHRSYAKQERDREREVAHLARDGGSYGAVTPSVTVDMATVRQRKRDMVERQVTKHLQLYRTSGAELISGRFLAPKTLEVKLNDGGTRVLVADRVFLNVGTHHAIPNVPGLNAAQSLTHIEALELDYLHGT